MLIAAEFPIYGRFGYGSAADHAEYEIDARTVQFVQPGSGTVELVDAAELRKAGAGAVRAPPPGPARRSSSATSAGGTARLQDHAGAGRQAVQGLPRPCTATTRGEPEGYLRYHTDGKWDVRRPERHARGRRAARRHAGRLRPPVAVLLRGGLGGHGRAPATAAPTRRCPWIVDDGRHVVQKWRGRLPVGAHPRRGRPPLSARTYLTPGRVVLEVVDAQGLATGRFAARRRPRGRHRARPRPSRPASR